MSLDPYQLAWSQQQAPKRSHISTETRSRIPAGLRQGGVLPRMQESMLLFSFFFFFCQFQSCTQSRAKNCQAVNLWEARRIWSAWPLNALRKFRYFNHFAKPRWCKLRTWVVSEKSLWFDIIISGTDTRCEHGPKWFVSIQFDLNIWFSNLMETNLI